MHDYYYSILGDSMEVNDQYGPPLSLYLDMLAQAIANSYEYRLRPLA